MKTVAAAVAAYAGVAPEQLFVVPDPLVAGTYAARAIMPGGVVLDFLVVEKALHKVTVDDLEEVTFATWPPNGTGRPTAWRIE